MQSRELDIAAPAVQARWEFTQTITTSRERDIDGRIQLASYRAFIAQKGSLHESQDPWGRFTVHRVACGAQCYFVRETRDSNSILQHPGQIATSGSQLYVSLYAKKNPRSVDIDYLINQFRSQRTITRCIHALRHHGKCLSWTERDDSRNRVPKVLDRDVFSTTATRLRSSCRLIDISGLEHVLATTYG